MPGQMRALDFQGAEKLRDVFNQCVDVITGPRLIREPSAPRLDASSSMSNQYAEG
jgi:hypothetical protein